MRKKILFLFVIFTPMMCIAQSRLTLDRIHNPFIKAEHNGIAWDYYNDTSSSHTWTGEQIFSSATINELYISTITKTGDSVFQTTVTYSQDSDLLDGQDITYFISGSSVADTYVHKTGDTMTGDLTISKSIPKLTFYSTGDNNSAAIDRTDTNAVLAFKNIVLRQGKIDGAIEFNGDDERFVIPFISDYAPGTNDFTVMCWAKPASQDVKGTVFYIYGGTTDGYFLVQTNDGSGKWAFRIIDQGVTISCYSDSFPDTSAYTHLAGVRESGTMMLYVNGVAQADTKIEADDISPNGDVYIGVQSNMGTEFVGIIDEVKLFNYAVPVASITAEYNSGDGVYSIEPENNLVGGWHFDDNGFDYSVNKNTGTKTDAYYVAGFINVPGEDIEATLLTSEDGSDGGELGKTKLMSNNGLNYGEVGLDGKTIRFYNEGVETMRQDDDGQFGIGTTDAETEFHVVGDITCEDIIADDSTGIVVKAQDGTEIMTFENDYTVTSSTINAQGYQANGVTGISGSYIIGTVTYTWTNGLLTGVEE